MSTLEQCKYQGTWGASDLLVVLYCALTPVRLAVRLWRELTCPRRQRRKS
jgi:hypothetical protein